MLDEGAHLHSLLQIIDPISTHQEAPTTSSEVECTDTDTAATLSWAEGEEGHALDSLVSAARGQKVLVVGEACYAVQVRRVDEHGIKTELLNGKSDVRFTTDRQEWRDRQS